MSGGGEVGKERGAVTARPGLVEGWQEAAAGTPPLLFPGDEFLLDEECSSEVALHQSFDSFIGSPDFNIRARRELHLGLVPQPFMGDLERARVVILLSNPGLSPDDYFAESQQPAFTDRLLDNLRQENRRHDYPFLFLDPRYSWHAGFTWWESKLHEVAAAIERMESCSYQDALLRLSRELAALELVPYHSTQFGFRKSVHGRLQSTRAVRSYVRDVLLPRAVRGEILIVVTRGNQYWEVPEETGAGVVVYRGGETRGASLTLSTRGGRAIADVPGV